MPGRKAMGLAGSEIARLPGSLFKSAAVSRVNCTDGLVTAGAFCPQAELDRAECGWLEFSRQLWLIGPGWGTFLKRAASHGAREGRLTMQTRSSERRTRKGFTLVELAVVVVIIGVLAAFGVPRLLKAVERSKAGESFNYLGVIREAQERYNTRTGTYAALVTDLDVDISNPTYFTVGIIAAGITLSLEDSWTLTLTRTGAAAGYGAYTVIFNEDGYAVASTIPAAIMPMGT